MANKNVHVSVPFSPEQHSALESVSETDGRSKAAQVRHYCAPHLQRVIAAMKKASKGAPEKIKNHRKV